MLCTPQHRWRSHLLLHCKHRRLLLMLGHTGSPQQCLLLHSRDKGQLSILQLPWCLCKCQLSRQQGDKKKLPPIQQQQQQASAWSTHTMMPLRMQHQQPMQRNLQSLQQRRNVQGLKIWMPTCCNTQKEQPLSLLTNWA